MTSKTQHFGYEEEDLWLVRETFTGDGADTTFQLTGNLGNASFESGEWVVAGVKVSMQAYASKTDGATLYDSIVPLLRNKISVSSISASGLVTLSHAPMAENFYVWYWYDISTNGSAIEDYFRDEFVAGVEGEGSGSGVTNPLELGTDDDDPGIVYLYGGGVGEDGGVIRLHLGSDDDATIDYFSVQVVEDDLLIGPNTDTDALKLDANKDFWITSGYLRPNVHITFTNNNAAIEVGTTDGADDGVLALGGGGVPSGTRGGVINLYGNERAVYPGSVHILAGAVADSGVQISGGNVSGSYVQLGVAGVPDVVKLDYNKDLWLTVGKFYTVNDVIIDLATKGLVLKDTQGTPHYWRVTVSTLGVLTTSDLGTGLP